MTNSVGGYGQEARDIVNGGIEEISSALASGAISPTDVVEMLRNKIPGIMNFSEEFEYPKERWPEDKLKGERAIDFLVRSWGELIENGVVLRVDIYECNAKLYGTLNTFYSRIKQKQLDDPDYVKKKYNNIPQYVWSWFESKSISSSQEVDQELKKYNIQIPSDAFSRGLDKRHAKRLYEASKRRQQ